MNFYVKILISDSFAIHIYLIPIQLVPQTVWLRARFANRTYWPDGGIFDLNSVESFSLLVVEGVPCTQSTEAPEVPHSSRSTTTLSSTPSSGSGPSSSKQPTTPTWPGFASVVHSQTKGLAKKKASVNHTLKVIVASINHVDGDKPSFNKRDLVYVSISESTATLPHVLSAVRDQLGEEYIIVTSDGFEVKDSPGTQGTCTSNTMQVIIPN